MTIAAGEMSECTGQVVYCNFTLRPLRARYLPASEAETAVEIVHYPFEKRQENTHVSYALVSETYYFLLFVEYVLPFCALYI